MTFAARFGTGCQASYTGSMELHLALSQEASLNELAARTGRDRAGSRCEAARDHEWFSQQVQICIDQINAANLSKRKRWTRELRECLKTDAIENSPQI
jgi:hypothetical protein